jgi:hypothetical protein
VERAQRRDGGARRRRQAAADLGATTSRAQLGRGAVQETGPATRPPASPPPARCSTSRRSPSPIAELGHFLQQLALGWARPGGCVAHLALPWSLQTELCDPVTAPQVALGA